MKETAFIFSLLCFLSYLRNQRKRSRVVYIPPAPPAHKSREGQQVRQRATKPRAGTEYNILRSRLKTLYSMRAEAMILETRAKNNLDHIRHLNQYGAVISDKTEARAQNALLVAQKRKISIENQIMATEKELTARG